MDAYSPHRQLKGRGSSSQMPGRFAIAHVELDETGQPMEHPETEFRQETAKRVITRNQSPDVPFSLSVNPYRGCEQGCIYCFARPSHAYLDLSPGLDFETRISVKHNVAECFERELSLPSYRCEPITLGVNTDAYQPVEKRLGLTRRLLEIALAFGQPVSLITKSGLILRDKDLLSALAERNLLHVSVSLTTLDNELKRIMEPRAASPGMRLKVMRELSELNIPVTVLAAPVIPLINDSELEAILGAAAEAGATSASYVLLRLPHELTALFVEWLYQHFPQRAGHVIKRLEDMRGGKLYQSQFGERMRGSGIFAELIGQRFRLARKKAGLEQRRAPALDCTQFQVPARSGDQLTLL